MKITDAMLRRVFKQLDKEGEAATKRVWPRFKESLAKEKTDRLQEPERATEHNDPNPAD